MVTTQVLIAGFGGQGILFSGKLLAYSGLMSGLEVSWLPSYGPEMRGGTASCSINLSDEQIASPIISNPDVLIAMNLPSLDKYEGAVKKGGFIVYDGSLISREVAIDGVKAFKIPATQLASENGFDGLANMIILGKAIKECGILSLKEVEKGMSKVVSAAKQALFDKNIKAVELGYNYQA